MKPFSVLVLAWASVTFDFDHFPRFVFWMIMEKCEEV